MAPFSFRLHFPFITSIIFLIITPANAENAKYVACSTLYTCGKIQKVGYPFWGESRPKYCGIADFKLSCDDDKNTSFNVFDNLDFALRVQGINTSSHTMNFSLEKISKYCYLQYFSIMKIIHSTLKLNSAYNQTVSLFYGCDKHCVSNQSNHHSYKSFTCSIYGDGTKGTGYYFGQSSKGRRIGKDCSCKNNITVPVDEKVLDALRSTNASVLDILIRRPIETNYKVNFIDHCVKCEHSGGRCGSPDNPSSDQFVCYCEDGPSPLVCHATEEKKVKLILGLGIGGAIAVVVAITAIWHCKKLFVTQIASLDSSASELEKGSIYFSVPLFSYSELVEATANFNQSNELGDGGFGIVFYGKLNDGREVAVKRLYEKSYKRVEQFMNEVRILTLLRHQNLVSLYGCTSHQCKELLLVYEFVKNGTVSDHLYRLNCKSVTLQWPVRLRIAIETATALSYLHASDIIHRDVKTNNILLDSNFGVKVADFGLSRLFPTDATHVSTAPQGTPGYLDPQYHQCYQLTNKSDVYSFGVVLIELISSLPAIDMNRDNHEINLSTFAMNRIQRCAFDELVDPQLGFALDFKARRMITSVAELAFQCLQHDKELRPSMGEVLEVLKRIESTDYEALSQAEETANIDEEVLNMHISNPPATPAEDDHAQLLSNHKLFSSSPISVMGKWVSGSTTYSSSK